MKKYLLILVCIIAVFSTYLYLENKAKLGELVFETKKLSIGSDKDGYKIEAEYPVIKSGIPEKSKAKINSQIENYINTSINQSKTDFIELAKDLVELRSAATLTYFGKFVVTNDFTKLPYINIQFDTNYYSGGAHGINTVDTFVFDAHSGERLEFSQIFNTDYLKLLSKLSLAELKVKDPKLEIYTFAEDGTAPIEANFKSFTLEPDGLRIIFGDYQVGPYVIGRPEIVIKYSDLSSVLKPEINKILEKNK
jgi:Protein of unknown function (DUF3298)/Deacetylase PdaC